MLSCTVMILRKPETLVREADGLELKALIHKKAQGHKNQSRQTKNKGPHTQKSRRQGPKHNKQQKRQIKNREWKAKTWPKVNMTEGSMKQTRVY